jgi:hypothetical protein
MNREKCRLNVLHGNRDKLEAEIVEGLFLGRHDPAKTESLKKRGRLAVIGLETTGDPGPSERSTLRR